VRRREFITLLGGAAAAWPLAARAQQPAMPVIGVLSGRSLDDSKDFVSAFAQGLNEAGFFEHRNVAIEYRWAENHVDRLPALAAELVRQQVAVILAVGGVPPTQAAKAATSIIPIVFIVGGDPVKLGLVASLNRPSGNVTGVTILSGALTAKRLELLRELRPQAGIACLVNPSSPEAETQLTDIREAARTTGQELRFAERQQRSRPRCGLRDASQRANRRVAAGERCILRRPPRTNRRAGGPSRYPDHVLLARVCRRRWPNELWQQPCQTDD
jgi:putative ABC transport system substrate-binding protein